MQEPKIIIDDLKTEAEKELPEKSNLSFLEGLNREQRRKWLRQHKRKLKKLGLGK
jgi:hypothetical protein